jgi:hypothetical protein
LTAKTAKKTAQSILGEEVTTMDVTKLAFDAKGW